MTTDCQRCAHYKNNIYEYCEIEEEERALGFPIIGNYCQFFDGEKIAIKNDHE